MNKDLINNINEFDSLDIILIRNYIAPCLGAISKIRDTLYYNIYLHEMYKDISANEEMAKFEYLFVRLDIIESSLFAFRRTEIIKELNKFILKEARKTKIFLSIFNLPIIKRFMFYFAEKFIRLFYDNVFSFIASKYEKQEIDVKMEKGFDDFDRFHEILIENKKCEVNNV